MAVDNRFASQHIKHTRLRSLVNRLPKNKRHNRKHRGPTRRAEGTGGGSGFVVDLTHQGDGAVDSIYTVQVSIGSGSDKKEYPMQIDTGSSDTWIASQSCSSQPCTSYKGPRYSPAPSAIDTETDFALQYFRGSVQGEIFWDTFELGGYSISNQAIAVASTMDSENLSTGFSGLLGFAFDSISNISAQLPARPGNQPDGASVASNLFGLGPGQSPNSHFISLSFERPGLPGIPSRMGIGLHPVQVVPDPSKIHYVALANSVNGPTHWRVPVLGITAFVNSQILPIDLGRSNTLGNIIPVGVIDSGGPNMLASTAICNAFYGAWGIGPSADGMYYVDCKTPLNATVNIGGISYPIHPLDLSYPTPSGTKYCVGGLQAANGIGAGDIILGASFMRNVYTVLSLDRDNDQGTDVPMVGLMSLTDPTKALDEFNTIRVLGQPIGSSTNGTHSSGASSQSSPGHNLRLPLIIVAAVIGFFALCCSLFVLRWYLLRRRPAANGPTNAASVRHEKGPNGTDDAEPVSEETLRAIRRERYLQRNSSVVTDSFSSASTRVGDVTELGFKGDDPYPTFRASTPTTPTFPRASSLVVDTATHARKDSEIPLLTSLGTRYPPRPLSEIPHAS